MPPVMMTKPSPMENRPKSPIRLAVLAMLMGERKRGLMIAVDGPHHQDQNEKPQILLQHGAVLSALADLNGAYARRRAAAHCVR